MTRATPAHARPAGPRPARHRGRRLGALDHAGHGERGRERRHPERTDGCLRPVERVGQRPCHLDRLDAGRRCDPRERVLRDPDRRTATRRPRTPAARARPRSPPRRPRPATTTGVPDGTYHYTVTAVYRSWTATSAASGDVVTAATLDHFAVTAPANATAGTAFDVTVTAKTASNDTLAGYDGHGPLRELRPRIPAASVELHLRGGRQWLAHVHERRHAEDGRQPDGDRERHGRDVQDRHGDDQRRPGRGRPLQGDGAGHRHGGHRLQHGHAHRPGCSTTTRPRAMPTATMRSPGAAPRPARAGTPPAIRPARSRSPTGSAPRPCRRPCSRPARTASRQPRPRPA